VAELNSFDFLNKNSKNFVFISQSDKHATVSESNELRKGDPVYYSGKPLVVILSIADNLSPLKIFQFFFLYKWLFS